MSHPAAGLPSPVGVSAPVVALVVTVEALLNTDLGDGVRSLSLFLNRSDRNGPRIFGTGLAVTSVDVVPCVVSVSVRVVGGLLVLTFSSLSGWLSVGGAPCGFGAGTRSTASGVGLDAANRLSVFGGAAADTVAVLCCSFGFSVFGGAGPDTVAAICCSFVVGVIVTGGPLIP